MPGRTPAKSSADDSQQVHDLVEEIREAIVSGRLYPNERLVEGDVAERFSSSRAAVRAALLELTVEGLVDREMNRGARVHAVSLDEAIQICEVRVPLEGVCAAKAAEQITEEECTELRSVISQMESAISRGDVYAYADLNNSLQLRIYQISRHPIAVGAAMRLRNLASRTRFRTAFVPGRSAVTMPEHREMVDAIVARSPERAARAAEAHFASVLKTLQSLNESDFV